MKNRDKLLKFIDINTFITLGEARKLGVSPMMLSRLATNEEIFRTERGVYTRDLDWLTDSPKKYVAACTLYPKAVICGVSALTHYDLTDEEERRIWIALPAPMVIHNRRYRVIRPSGICYSLGVQTHHFRKRVVRMYDLEKTVVDSFKYLTIEVAMKALKGYVKRKDANVPKLCDYARKMRKPLDDIITALLAEE